MPIRAAVECAFSPAFLRPFVPAQYFSFEPAINGAQRSTVRLSHISTKHTAFCSAEQPTFQPPQHSAVLRSQRTTLDDADYTTFSCALFAAHVMADGSALGAPIKSAQPGSIDTTQRQPFTATVR
jgi:hypothetical protein